MADPKHKLRWFPFNLRSLLIVVLIVEAFLLLAEKLQWFGLVGHRFGLDRLRWDGTLELLTLTIGLAVVIVPTLFISLWIAARSATRKRFQFSLRTLLVIVTLSAILFSWLTPKIQRMKRERDAAAAIAKLGGHICWASPSWPTWLPRVPRDDFFSHVSFLYLDGPQVTDAVLENLEELHEVTFLKISAAPLPAFLASGGPVPTSTAQYQSMVESSRTKVTDAGLEHLQGLTELRYLTLEAPQVTDAGLEHLKALTGLRTLSLADTKVTHAGVNALQQALPNCEIRCEPRPDDQNTPVPPSPSIAPDDPDTPARPRRSGG